MIKALTPIICALVILLLVGYALHLGIDGVLLAGVIAILAGLGGYQGKILKDKVKKNKE